MKYNLKFISLVAPLMMVAVSFSSCYKNFADAPYPAQAIYMPAATNGLYMINGVATPGQTFRYTVDPVAAKFIVPLSVYRSGLYSYGAVNADIAVRADTVNSLISSGVLTNTSLLPSTAYRVTPSVVIPDGETLGTFAISIDLNFLLVNATKTYAIAVSVSSSQVPATSKNVAVIIINPAFLIPVANFTYVLDSTTPKQYNFTNTSTNSVAYSWNFGDGSPAVTTASASHIFASGTYTVTLTSIGAAGTINPATKTTTLVVP